MTIPTRIFLSYARGDDEPFVGQLYADLTAHGFQVWWDRQDMPSRGLTFLQEIRDAILAGDRLVLVVGPKAVTSDYVAAEWQCALEACQVVTPVLRLGDYTLLPERLSRAHCVDMRASRPYALALAELLRVLDEPVAELCELHNVPSLPANFLARPADLQVLGELVLSDVVRPTVITSAKQTALLQGMGGVGKSVLAAAFARSCEARRAFRDGIFWLTVGQQPDLFGLAQTAAMALGGDKSELYDLPSAWGLLGKLLADKTCLLVLDDVWDVRHVEKFCAALGPAGRMLVTTRDGGLATALGASVHRLDMLPEEDALRLMAKYAGLSLPAGASPDLPAAARQVAHECGCLPFALALCGAMHADHVSWEDILASLQAADLSFIEKQLPNYPFPDMLKSIKVSLDMLGRENPDYEKHYRELAVFAKDAYVPEAAVVQLWTYTNGLNERGARKLLGLLDKKALLRLEGQEPNRKVELHDLHHDYLLAVMADLSGLHSELLAAYQEKCPQGWPSGPKDGYFYENLAYHLAQAGRKDELHDLLCDFRWCCAKLEVAGVNDLIRDYNQIGSLDRNDGLALIRDALRLSSHVVAKDGDQLAPQLLGRLLDFDQAEIENFLEQAKHWTDKPWLRPLYACLTAPGGALLRTLEGHIKSVNGVALTLDGHYAVSASYDKTLKVWDLASGECLRTLEGHTKGVFRMALTLDGRCAVSASEDCTLKVWDVESGNCLRTLEGHTKGVRSVALTPDGRCVVSASIDHTLKVWDLARGECLRTLEGHTNYVEDVALTLDGRCAVSASWDNTLKVWDLASGECLRTLEGHTSYVFGVALTPDGRCAVSASRDHTLKVWDLASGECLRTLEGHTDGLNGVVLTPDGRCAVSASYDKTLKVWDLASGECLRTLEGHTDSVTGVALTPDGRRAVSASWDDTLKVWDLTSGERRGYLHTLEGHTNEVKSVALTPDGRCAVSASWDSTLKVWDVASGECLRTLKGHSNGVHGMALTPNGRFAVSASEDDTLKVWDVASEGCLRTLEGHIEFVRRVALTPDGRYGVSASYDKTLKVWDLASGECLRTLAGHKHWVTGVALTPDGRCAVSASFDKTLKVWDLASGECLRTLKGHTEGVHSVALTPDGRCAVSASWDNMLKVWDLASSEGSECLYTLEGHTHYVEGVALTADGRCAVSASYDKTLKVWDVASGKCLRTLAGHTSKVNGVVLTPDGRWAVSISDDHTLKVWDVASGECIASFFGEGEMESTDFSPDEMTLVAGDSLGTVYFFNLENITPALPILTAWQLSFRLLFWKPTFFAFGCLHCRTWSVTLKSELGTEIACPHCGRPVKLNSFTIQADWRPVAKAWKGVSPAP